MATSSIDLMILGALKERPMSAYEMNKLMDARAVRKWVRASAPSVYRNLVKLCQAGYATGRVEREGAAPERTVYTITDAGLARFDELMQVVSRLPARVDFDFTPVIANLYVTDEPTGRALLDAIRTRYREQAERLEDYAPAVPRIEARANLELRAATYRLVIDWLERFEEDFYRMPPELRGWVSGTRGELGGAPKACENDFDWDAWRCEHEAGRREGCEGRELREGEGVTGVSPKTRD